MWQADTSVTIHEEVYQAIYASEEKDVLAEDIPSAAFMFRTCQKKVQDSQKDKKKKKLYLGTSSLL